MNIRSHLSGKLLPAVFRQAAKKSRRGMGKLFFLFTNMSKEIHLLPFMEPGRVEAGCDEAGRGPLAGPVYAAAVILPPDFHHPLLNDSKKMSEKSRETLRPVIEREAVAWAVEAVSPEEIDNLNILWASVTGMQRAVRRLDPRPDFLLIDGNRFRPFDGYDFDS